jgi:hypothetical protein
MQGHKSTEPPHIAVNRAGKSLGDSTPEQRLSVAELMATVTGFARLPNQIAILTAQICSNSGRQRRRLAATSEVPLPQRTHYSPKYQIGHTSTCASHDALMRAFGLIFQKNAGPR